MLHTGASVWFGATLRGDNEPIVIGAGSNVQENTVMHTDPGCPLTVGANCTVVCGHAIGPYAFVAAGAVVTKDVPPHALVLGTPARPAGWMCRCGEKLPVAFGDAGEATCARCADRYRITPTACERMERA